MILRFTSIQAPNADQTCAAVVRYVAGRLGVPAEFVENAPWQERARLLARGDVQVGWVCGLPYVRETAWLPLAAPVMAGQRYGGRPVYFSDVTVRADSPYRSFSDLRGCRWAYNEPGSHSGYGVVRYHLATLGADGGYFGQVIEAGSHQNALQMILSGTVDAAALDSTVLETELRARPALAEALRVVETIGPSPVPLWVAHASVPRDVRCALRAALVGMDSEATGRDVLQSGAMLRFVGVTDADYDPTRRMAALGERVTLMEGTRIWR
jgi:phosphonate transport system substrate-binding protein